jgi:hypothetical protein
MVMTSATTAAKMGRAMKKWLSRMSLVPTFAGVRPLASEVGAMGLARRRGV